MFRDGEAVWDTRIPFVLSLLRRILGSLGTKGSIDALVGVLKVHTVMLAAKDEPSSYLVKYAVEGYRSCS